MEGIVKKPEGEVRRAVEEFKRMMEATANGAEDGGESTENEEEEERSEDREISMERTISVEVNDL